MGVVPLLTREGEVAIAKRIERGQLKTQKAIARSPIAVRELLKIGEELEAGKLNIRDTVVFSEQAELTGDEDKAKSTAPGPSKAFRTSIASRSSP